MVDEKLWEEDPAKAARLAYLELQIHWHQQVVEGVCTGIPDLERVVYPAQNSEVMADSKARHYRVPNQVAEAWQRVCLA